MLTTKQQNNKDYPVRYMKRRGMICFFLMILIRYTRTKDLASNLEAEMFRRSEVAKGNRRTFIVGNKTEVTLKRTNLSIYLRLC